MPPRGRLHRQAERRLRLATNMIQRLQAVVRLWLKRVRKRREGYKVTMRTELLGEEYGQYAVHSGVSFGARASGAASSSSASSLGI